MAKVAEKRDPAAPVLTLALAASLGVAVAAVGAVAVGTAGCAPEPPRVSPLWGGDPLIPPLSVYVEAPDLTERLRSIDAETAELGLRMTLEVRGALPKAAGTVVVRAYEGVDALGRKTHAVRAATPRGIIMAAGPRAYPEQDALGARAATELVPALVPDPDGAEGGAGGAFRAATDINGDGYPDVVLRNEVGALEVWRLGSFGASRYEVRMEAPPTRAVDADSDGQIDFEGEVPGAPSDAIAPELIDFAMFDGAGYTNAAPGARKEHKERAKALEAQLKGPPAKVGDSKGASGESETPSPAPVSDEVRLRRALSLAWHAILSGGSREDTLKKLDSEQVPAPLKAEFERHRSRIERIGRKSP